MCQHSAMILNRGTNTFVWKSCFPWLGLVILMSTPGLVGCGCSCSDHGNGTDSMTDSMADSTEIDDEQVTDSLPDIPTDTTTDPSLDDPDADAVE